MQEECKFHFKKKSTLCGSRKYPYPPLPPWNFRAFCATFLWPLERQIFTKELLENCSRRVAKIHLLMKIAAESGKHNYAVKVMGSWWKSMLFRCVARLLCSSNDASSNTFFRVKNKLSRYYVKTLHSFSANQKRVIISCTLIEKLWSRMFFN